MTDAIKRITDVNYELMSNMKIGTEFHIADDESEDAGITFVRTKDGIRELHSDSNKATRTLEYWEEVVIDFDPMKDIL